MKQHPHAEALRAIADGVPLSEFDCKCQSTEYVATLDKMSEQQWIYNPTRFEVTRKPQHIMVNGFKVPKPLNVMSCGDYYFLADVTDEQLFVECKCRDDASDQSWIVRGICHATQEAAIAHAKAMLGIDPEYFK